MDSTGSMVGLLATSKRTYTNMNLPALLLPVPLSPWQTKLTRTSTRDPQTFTGRSGSVFYGLIAPFPWVLVWTRFCLCTSTVSVSSSSVEVHRPQDWKRSVSFLIPKKGNAKECSNHHIISHASKVMLKSFKLGFSSK